MLHRHVRELHRAGAHPCPRRRCTCEKNIFVFFRRVPDYQKSVFYRTLLSVKFNGIGIWSSFVEGDEQPTQLNSQSCIESCNACAALFFEFVVNTTAYHLGRYSLHLLLLKSSMV